jgi:V/A-type H+-transporting ATPase subunit D
MSIKVPPSKMNLIKFKRTLAFLSRAHDLLEEKRDILLMEVTRRVGEATKVRAQLNQILKEAYAALDAAAVIVGPRELEAASRVPRTSFNLVSSKRKVMGVTTISLEMTDAKKTIGYDISRPSILVDEMSEKFSQALPLIIRVAELESTMIRLTEEVKKTQQRVNALEQFLIPQCSATVSLITSVLEERDREEFVRVKKVKSLLEKRSTSE